MRSRTSRGVPEWSEGKDLYTGSPALITGKVSGDISNVPGPPVGSRWSTKWGHQPRRAAWAKCGRGPAPGGLVRPPPTKAQGAGKSGRGQTLGQMGPKAHPRCASPPPLWPPPRWDLGAAATPGEGTLGGGAAPPLPLYILEVWGCPTHDLLSLLAQPFPLPCPPPLPRYLAKPCRIAMLLHHHHAVVLLLDGVFPNLFFSPCWIKA